MVPMLLPIFILIDRGLCQTTVKMFVFDFTFNKFFFFFWMFLCARNWNRVEPRQLELILSNDQPCKSARGDHEESNTKMTVEFAWAICLHMRACMRPTYTYRRYGCTMKLFEDFHFTWQIASRSNNEIVMTILQKCLKCRQNSLIINMFILWLS